MSSQTSILMYVHIPILIVNCENLCTYDITYQYYFYDLVELPFSVWY